jgi:hypothetical protein
MQSPRSLEARFYSGAYKDVLLATVDSPTGEVADDDTFLVVGALVFAGRTDEAATLFRAWERQSPRSLEGREQAAACRFFLCIADCRAGRYAAAERLCKATLSELRESSTPKTRFFLHQGVGLVRHFTGRMANAARHAARARRYALEARFPYGRMLSLDLLGHAQLNRGKVLTGLVLLEQAADLAEGIGLVSLARTTRSAIVANRARFAVGDTNPIPSLLHHLEQLGDADRYSARILLTELAEAHAFRGDAQSAIQTLRRAEDVALPDGDRRATVKLYLARALVEGLSRGEPAAAAWINRAQELVDVDRDPALAVEITWYEYLVCSARFSERDPVPMANAAERTGIARAAYLARARGAALDARPTEDRFAELVLAIRHSDRGIDRVLTHETLGFLPLATGHRPGQRIYLDSPRRLFAIEREGNITRADYPSDSVVTLLRAIAARPKSKEDLILEVWHLNVYRPDRHDAVVHTAISRLRTALGNHAAWVQAASGGYGLAPGVELVDLSVGQASAGRSTANLPGDSSDIPAPSEPQESASREPESDPRRAIILELVARADGAATRDVAERLQVSEMTALRLLGALVDEGCIERVGRGRGTRYRPPSC